MNRRRTVSRRPFASARVGLGMLAALLACAGPAAAGTGFVPAADLRPIIDGYPFGPNVASAADGTGFTAWIEPGTPAHALVAVRPPGGSWATQDLGPTVQSTPGGLSIATSADGSATALVIDPDGKTLRALTRPPGGAFGTPRALTVGNHLVLGTAVAMNAAGDAIAAWRESPDGGTNWQTVADYRDAGGWNPSAALGPAEPVSFAATDGVSAAINDAGRSAVTYTGYDGTYLRARTSIRPVGGSFPATATTLDPAAINTFHATVAMSASGATVVGYQRDNASPSIYWRYTVPGATAFEPAQQLSAPGDRGSNVTVTTGPGDQLAAAWLLQPAQRVQFGVGTTTAGFSGARRFVSPAGDPADTPALTIDAKGNRFVAWANGTSETVQAAYQPAGSADFAATQTVAAGGSGAPSDLSAALDAQGNVLIAWTRSSAPSPGQFAQVAGYDVGPPSFSDLSFPATAPLGAAAAFSATATDVWSTPTITWSFGDGASAAGSTVTHTFGGASTFTTTATATDAFGNATSASSPVTVAAPPPPPPVLDLDADGDGVAASRDCNDHNAAIRPGAPDPPGDGIDQDCSGADSRFATLTAGATLTWGRLRKGAPTPIPYQRVDVGRDSGTLRVTSQGKGCAKRASPKPTTLTAKKVKKGLFSLTGAVGGLRLGTGTTLTVTVARAGYVSRIFRYAMRSGKTPLKTTRCQAPNAKTSTVCG